MATLNVAPGVTNLIPETTLQRLTPRRDGIWFVSGQAEDHFTLAYVMDEGTHALTYNMFPCTTEEEVLDVCGHLMYTYKSYTDSVSHGTFPGRLEPGSQPVHLVRRPRANVVQSLAGIDLSSDLIQDQAADVLQPGFSAQSHDQVHAVAQGSLQNAANQFMQSPVNEQGQQQMMHSAGGNRIMDWAVTNDIFNDIAPVVNGGNNSFDTLCVDNILGPMLNEYSSTAESMPLADGGNEGQLDWDTFTNN